MDSCGRAYSVLTPQYVSTDLAREGAEGDISTKRSQVVLSRSVCEQVGVGSNHEILLM